MVGFWMVIVSFDSSYICIADEEVVGIPLTSLTPPHLSVYSKPGPQISSAYVVFNNLRWEVIVSFVDIDERADHTWLDLLLIMLSIVVTTRLIGRAKTCQLQSRLLVMKISYNENLVILKRVFMLINFLEYIAKTKRAINNWKSREIGSMQASKQKHIQKSKKVFNTDLIKNRCGLMYSRKVSSSCFVEDTHRATHIIKSGKSNVGYGEINIKEKTIHCHTRNGYFVAIN